MREITREQITAAAGKAAERVRHGLLESYRHGGAAAAGAEVSRLVRVRGAQLVLLLVDRDGRFLAGNVADWPPTVTAGGEPTTIEIFRIDRDLSERMRVIATRFPDGSRLLTGHVIESELRFARAMEEAMLLAMAVALIFAGLAGVIAARMIEQRLGRTVATADAVAAGDLTRRVPLRGGNDAFEALAAAINAMLDRIAALVGELKVATDGLAHDLRAPLTRLRATLERALAAAPDEAGRTMILRAMEEGERLLAMLDTALRITRAEAGLGREAFGEVDVGAMLVDLADMFGPLAEDRGKSIAVDIAPPITINANREMLGQSLANLIDNALKYGAGTITLSAVAHPHEVAISVADEGVGIPPAARHDALKRFGRLDAARHEGGAGLGLSLVAAVAHLHGGTLTLGDNAPGLIATMTIAA
ncbi:HAMP domain-containing sensor histidine kinase [uncultured Sphingomonas sp.]|uniref:sensor histidine kinase n=1 Tax=uncultured Sphingomonas sp. TaxID=158754 RepID=UPI002612DB39|nr:HAMP domain-containing sensor histidine kinase [uncultured Sphingomonas sp.]